MNKKKRKKLPQEIANSRAAAAAMANSTRGRARIFENPKDICPSGDEEIEEGLEEYKERKRKRNYY